MQWIRAFGVYLMIVAALMPIALRGEDVLTQRGNNQQTGVTISPGLNQASVRDFKLLHRLMVDAPVSAKPTIAVVRSANDREK